MLQAHKYTLYGIAAILLWSCVIGIARKVAELLGPIGGAASIYTVATLVLICVVGSPQLKTLSKRYVLVAGGLFTAYEVCLSLAIGMANSRQQALDMAVINYLWPALTVLIAVISSSKKTNSWVYPSVALAFIGVAWAITGDQSLSVSQLAQNVQSNPATYAMALIGAFLWAIYCNITKRLSQGKNAITLFFAMTASVLWIRYALSSEPALSFNLESTFYLLLAAVIMASGYGLWNSGIMQGNMLLLATLSYFTPIFSTLFSSIILGVALSASFWQGVVMVVIGSLICWRVTQ
ncbi:aromatic amino acid DMT transporter YddG [Vibrio neonatus]|uniref:aromatic amino acid DMT transporter YddG n=1 Tax=Vibrio neonatus TaxID=278860 RepID=UPI0021C3032D|nr:aromatic amino acid DMT transporter YddG [Vibrio neonatus]